MTDNLWFASVTSLPRIKILKIWAGSLLALSFRRQFYATIFLRRIFLLERQQECVFLLWNLIPFISFSRNIIQRGILHLWSVILVSIFFTK